MKPYKRYIVFGFDQYYPDGGFDDVLGDCDSLEDVIEKIDFIHGYFTFGGHCRKTYQIFDRVEGLLITELSEKPGFLNVH